MKVKILLKNYLQMFFQNYLYLTILFTIIVFGLTADPLLQIGSIKKYNLLVLGMFFLSLFSTMNLYYNDSRQNKYLKQKVNSYWADALSQFLMALIVNVFSGILVFVFSLILSQNLLLDVVGIITLISVGMLGSAIATLFKTQWYNHPSLGQVGILVFIYLALSGSVISMLDYVEWLLPPLSKIIVTLQKNGSIQQLLPVTGQVILYALVLYGISVFCYKNSKKFK
ncbi:hypothetical protein [Companilactobacillus crustorum]|uniref:hypothetical protein n=1 Tax=Companilactobacillus crustorum TaxID=392416 RepID=UPI00096A499D|nr:hypothetical protein [Companilactobacillus crustorum]